MNMDSRITTIKSLIVHLSSGICEQNALLKSSSLSLIPSPIKESGATRGQAPLRAVPDKRNYEHCSSSLSSLLSLVPRLRATRKRDELDAPQPLETAISLTDDAAASQAEIGSFYNSSSPRAGTHAGTLQRTTSESPAFVPDRVSRA